MLGYDLNDPKLVNGPGVKGVLGELLFIVPPFVVVVVFWCAFFCVVLCVVSVCAQCGLANCILMHILNNHSHKKMLKLGGQNGQRMQKIHTPKKSHHEKNAKFANLHFEFCCTKNMQISRFWDMQRKIQT